MKQRCHKCGRLVSIKRYLSITGYWCGVYRVHKDEQGEYCAACNLPAPEPTQSAPSGAERKGEI